MGVQQWRRSVIFLCYLIALRLSLLCHVIVAVVEGKTALSSSVFFYLLKIIDGTREWTSHRMFSCWTKSDDVNLLSFLILLVGHNSLLINYFAVLLTLLFSVHLLPLVPFGLQVCGRSASHVQPSVAMDACARIRGVPIRSRASVRKEVCVPGHCILFCNNL